MLEAWQWVSALVVAVFAGAASGISGFGAGLIISAYLLPTLGAKVTVPVLAIAGILVNAGRIWAFRGRIALRPALLVMAGGAPATAAGAYFFAGFRDAMAELVVGGFLVAAIPLRRWLAGRRAVLPPAGLVGGAAVSGFASGMTTGSGVLLIPLFLGAGLAGAQLLATDAVASMVIGLTRIASYGGTGLVDYEVLLLGLALGVATVPGSHVAAWIVKRTGLALHTLILEVLVVAVGGFTAVRAVAALIS